MRVICLQEDLDPALQALSRITKKELFPLYQSVFFTATRPDHHSHQGTLTLMGVGIYGMVGMITHLPATVDQEGAALVSIDPLAEYVGGLRPGSLTLCQEREEMPATEEQLHLSVTEGQLPSSSSAALNTPTMAFPFQIDSTYVSDAATASTNQAKFATWEQWDHYPRPPIQDWLTIRMPVPSLPTASFKKAIACCSPFANKCARWKDEASEMYGILVRIAADSIEFTATGGTMLVAHRLRLERPVSFSFSGLFSGKALSWIKEALPEDEMTLALAWEEPAKPVLLISTEHMTWFCHSLDAPFPHTWTSTLRLSHEAELRVRRKDLTRPLQFFAAGSVTPTYQALSLLTKGAILWICPYAVQDAIMQDLREIPLVSSSCDLTLLVDPKQFKQIVRSVRDDVLQIQIGYFECQVGQIYKKIGFLRIVSEQTTVMMSLSRSESVPSIASRTSTPSKETISMEREAEPALASLEA